eukprot:CAMPEP_0117600214 /NCGR_PEP_ID=MMETSP0784-20121206/76365_1 /TAXON_ID=39447 /ORGANISM="" /LENGTH=582 /DNA_ID=CAMNT_0005402825 /DNA_START=54 /DNA_END=1802 /DNA_ORIENTATION=+
MRAVTTTAAASTSISGGRKVVDTLVSLGVDTIFGIPGTQTIPIYRGLRERASIISHVTARHEQGAGFMAEGFARATGKVGVACVVTGVGLTNLLTALADAKADSVPLLAISSQVPTFWSSKPSRQFNHFVPRSSVGIAASVTKKSVCVEEVQQIAPAIIEAYNLALNGRPGPVHVEICMDVLRALVPHEASVPVPPSKTTQHALPVGTRSALLEAAAQLWQCQRPIIVIGGGAVATVELLEPLAEALGAMVVTTSAGKGVLDERHQLSLGSRLHVLSQCTSPFQHADGLLLLGTQLSPTDWWPAQLDQEVELPRAAKTIVQIDIDPLHIRECIGNLPGAIAVEADAKVACGVLLEECSRLRRMEALPTSHWNGSPEVAVSDIRKVTDSVDVLSQRLGLNFSCTNAAGAQMRSILSVLRRVLPEEAIVTADVCRLSYVALSLFATYAPRNFLYPAGTNPLGFALPAAIGASLARPGVPVVVLVGDGGLQFTLQELAVASEQQLPLLLLLWNDRCYGEVKGQLLDDFANTLPLPDFYHICSAYKVPHSRCYDVASFEGALDEDAVQRVLRGEGGPIMIEFYQAL